MGELLVLWDVDYTLLSAVGLGNRLYQAVFRDMFGRDLPAVAPKAGRTDRAIAGDTLELAGVSRDRVDEFLAALACRVAALDGSVQAEVRALPGAAGAIAALKLAAAGLGEHLDLDVGAFGDVHEIRAELVPVARQAARAAYGADFGGQSTVLVGDTPLDVAAALATGARAVGVATGSFAAADLAAAGAHVVLPDLTRAALVLAAVTGQP